MHWTTWTRYVADLALQLWFFSLRCHSSSREQLSAMPVSLHWAQINPGAKTVNAGMHIESEFSPENSCSLNYSLWCIFFFSKYTKRWQLIGDIFLTHAREKCATSLSFFSKEHLLSTHLALMITLELLFIWGCQRNLRTAEPCFSFRENIFSSR